MATATTAPVFGQGNDIWNNLLAQLSKPPTSVTNAPTSGIPQLEQILAQLQSQGTPAGSDALIKEIFRRGQEAAIPGVTNAVNIAGARAGTSSYQALATNDINARLAGAAAVALQDNTKAAAGAATNLGNLTQKQTTTTGSKSLLESILLPVGGKILENKIAEMFAPAAISTTAKAATNLVNPKLLNLANSGVDAGISLADTIIGSGGIDTGISSEIANLFYTSPTAGAIDIGVNAATGAGAGLIGFDPVTAVGSMAAAQLIPEIPNIVRETANVVTSLPGAVLDTGGNILKDASNFVSNAWDSVANFFGF